MLHPMNICVICNTLEESHNLQKRLQSVGVHWLSGKVYLRDVKRITIGFSVAPKKFCMMDESRQNTMSYQAYVDKYLNSPIKRLISHLRSIDE